ncbi:MAG: hypothetical protein Q8Q09_15320 [Deltaproteobacteria bacterium]|nr:hypothetical protein [Deltaproteobacteria bacterium]
MIDPSHDDALEGAMRQALVATFADHVEDAELVLAEIWPFVECATRALKSSAPLQDEAWHEARSMAWLFAHRMGDQGKTASRVTAGFIVWREASGAAVAQACLDDLASLWVDGYARGREDRARAEGQRALADAAPLREVEEGVFLAIAAGPLDFEGAQRFAERVARELHRREARAVILDLGELLDATAGVLSELWAIASAARMLGSRAYVAGVHGVIGELVLGAGIADEGEVRVGRVSEAMALARAALAPAPQRPFWKRWISRGRPERS